MTDDDTQVFWWALATLRLSHPGLDPTRITQLLKATASVAFRPGESRVIHGDCTSAGYWCTEYRIESPIRPDHVFLWAEEFVSLRGEHIRDLLHQGYRLELYVGIHSKILALGFNIPTTPTLWELAIPIGIEYFSS